MDQQLARELDRIGFTPLFKTSDDINDVLQIAAFIEHASIMSEVSDPTCYCEACSDPARQLQEGSSYNFPIVIPHNEDFEDEFGIPFNDRKSGGDGWSLLVTLCQIFALLWVLVIVHAHWVPMNKDGFCPSIKSLISTLERLAGSRTKA